MRRCTRCGLLKPNANYPTQVKEVVTPERADQRGRCVSCRMHTAQMPHTTAPSQKSHAPDEPTRGPLELLALAERESWRARGAPIVPRSYSRERGGTPFEYPSSSPHLNN